MCIIHILSLAVQSDWAKWDNVIDLDLKWNEVLYAMSPSTLSFILNSIQQSLPDPRNLRRWKANPEAKCSLCNWKNVTHTHILCGCKVALEQGRVSFRHDSILKILQTAIEEKIKCVVEKGTVVNSEKIEFVKAGNRRWNKESKRRKTGILDEADDWVVNVDFRDNQKPFPPEILVTKDRPDVVIFSRVKKVVIIVELTSPSEENLEKWRYTKKKKYDLLAEHIREASVWTPHVLTVEVGARGFVASHATYVFNRLGLIDRNLTTKLSRTAIRASHFIWINRDNPKWCKPVAC